VQITNLHPKQFNYLSEALFADKLHHTFIFHGPSGGGKFIFALFLARFIQCEDKNKKEKPCGECANCKVSKDGFVIDTYTINKGKEEGILIDDIREMQKIVNLSASKNNYKIFIINNSQNISREARETLLKTLEEPPVKSLIILITNERRSLPKTILSRCPSIFFSRPNTKSIKEFLKKDIPDHIIGVYFNNIEKLQKIDEDLLEEEREKYQKLIEEIKIIFGDSLYQKMSLARETSLNKEPIEKVENWLSLVYNLFLIKMDLLKIEDKHLNCLEKEINYDKILAVLESLVGLVDNLKLNLSKKVLFEDFFLNI